MSCNAFRPPAADATNKASALRAEDAESGLDRRPEWCSTILDRLATWQEVDVSGGCDFVHTSKIFHHDRPLPAQSQHRSASGIEAEEPSAAKPSAILADASYPVCCTRAEMPSAVLPFAPSVNVAERSPYSRTIPACGARKPQVADFCARCQIKPMKNVQIIDGASNATCSLFEATDDEFAAIFPEGRDMETIEDLHERLGGEQAGRVLEGLWSPPS